MLAFLRKIRRSLIDSRSGQKYLLYAIGEIVLVMTGILLALQVSNWNENKKLDHKEAQLVKALHTELLLNYDYHEGYLNSILRIENTCRSVLKGIGQREDIISLDSLKKLISGLGLPLYTQKTAKFEQVIEGEDFNIIRNDSLRVLLMDYNSRIKLVGLNNINSFENWQKIMEHLNQHSSRRAILSNNSSSRFAKINDIGETTFPVDIFDLFNDLVFENLIVERLENNEYWFARMERFQDQLALIIDFIEKNYEV